MVLRTKDEREVGGMPKGASGSRMEEKPMKALDFTLTLLVAIALALLPAGSASMLALFTLGRGRYLAWMSGGR